MLQVCLLRHKLWLSVLLAFVGALCFHFVLVSTFCKWLFEGKGYLMGMAPQDALRLKTRRSLGLVDCVAFFLSCKRWVRSICLPGDTAKTGLG